MAIQSLYPTTRPSLSLDFSNTKTLDPRITFARASEGRYYDGKTVAKAEENLLTFSEQFDNAAWLKASVTVSPNSTTAPDGAATADTIAHAAASGEIYQNLSVGAGTVTYSVFAKYVDAQWIRPVIGSPSNNVSVWFDIQNGVLGASVANGTAAHVSSAIVSAGNGWYRCVITATLVSASGNVFQANTASANSSNTRAIGSFYLWGAQLEQRSSVTAYTPTTTQPITNYIPVLQTAAANVARFDHNPVTGESLGLLIEEARTNLLLRSAEFENASWAKNRCAVTPNLLVAPDGNLSADYVLCNETNANGMNVQINSVTITAGASVTGSVYLKRGHTDHALLILFNGAATNVVRCWFNLATGTVESNNRSGTEWTYSTASIVSVGNGWFRCSLTAATTVDTTCRIGIYPSVSANAATACTANVTFGYIWGAQLEAGAFPTSYIPTVASQVTRNADAASMTGTNFSSWYRTDEITAVFEANGPGGTNPAFNSAHLFVISDGTVNNRIRTARAGDASTTINEVRNSNVIQAAANFAAPANNAFFKGAFAIKRDDFAAVRDGGAPVTDTSGLVPLAPTLMWIGSSDGVNQTQWNSTIRKLAFYPRRLTNAQLQAITTP